MSKKQSSNRYDAIISEIFRNHFVKGADSFEFDRIELERVASKLKIELPKNLGDLIYGYRFRNPFPASILATATEGHEWIIALAGQSKYRFKLVKFSRLTPRSGTLAIKVPDATPEIIGRYALSDEQALLAKVRYNRLVDIFLGVTAYSLQSHMRTTVEGIGQIEIDEIYVGVNKFGVQFVIPVQAKGGNDKLGAVQSMQDVACCAAKFPNAVCRPVAVQFMDNGVIAMFETTVVSDELKIVDERHYMLVPADAISNDELARYGDVGKA